MANAGDAETVLLNDLRRKKKNIDVYLSKTFSIDTTLCAAAHVQPLHTLLVVIN